MPRQGGGGGGGMHITPPLYPVIAVIEGQTKMQPVNILKKIILNSC